MIFVYLLFKTIFQVIKSFLLPHVKDIGEKVKIVLEGPILNSADKIAAENIKKSLAVSAIVLSSFWLIVVLTNSVNINFIIKHSNLNRSKRASFHQEMDG